MEIKFMRSGGFAGAATNVGGTIELGEKEAHVSAESTDYRRDLTSHEAEQLRVAGDSAAARKSNNTQQSTVPDGFQYDITVTTKDGKSHALNVGDGYLASWVADESEKIWNHRVDSTRK